MPPGILKNSSGTAEVALHSPARGTCRGPCKVGTVSANSPHRGDDGVALLRGANPLCIPVQTPRVSQSVLMPVGIVTTCTGNIGWMQSADTSLRVTAQPLFSSLYSTGGI